MRGQSSGLGCGEMGGGVPKPLKADTPWSLHCEDDNRVTDIDPPLAAARPKTDHCVR